MTTELQFAETLDPRGHPAYLNGGPRDRQWWPYGRWLAARAESRHDGYPLDHAWGSSRCYLPTDQFTVNTDPRYVLRVGKARVWQYIPPTQWAQWGREYRTSEEPAYEEHRP
ncbi:hypothetical protein ALI144C_02855 [Actinosynnema sp. ALI-1.44]|uniref:hypothetical protein n=1 Tax=Actinosynnema sp. ALI-1.44 TaxID=1933779 RepID=UPI00097C95BB|nr:hypothetical protein [Actinosynnema sp. ALI-1.44]ONI90628.1 hypothetical protein ALI144C_02855 [Actinosynnema sp. ALI-1.44]